MAKFVKGDVVVVLFPFSDLSKAKRRPALVITELEGEDVILCQVTSKMTYDSYTISLENKDFKEGTLKQKSCIRPNRIFTEDKKIILYKIGNIKKEKINEVVFKIIEIIK